MADFRKKEDTLTFISRNEEHYRCANGDRYVIPVKVKRKPKRKKLEEKYEKEVWGGGTD